MLHFCSIMCWLHQGKGMGSPVLYHYITGSNLAQEFNPKLSEISGSLITRNQYSGTPPKKNHQKKQNPPEIVRENIELLF